MNEELVWLFLVYLPMVLANHSVIYLVRTIFWEH